MPVTDDDALREILGHDTVAVVGCSTSPGKDAHEVPKYMIDHGYEVVPVNPYADEIFGREASESLAEVTESVDIVDVFRPSDEVPGIVDAAVAREDVQAVWLQLGVTHDEAGERVEATEKRFVQDRCLKAEHGRLSG